jgi:ATP-dependent exoDNAse (exonuclease V) alpha subunit
MGFNVLSEIPSADGRMDLLVFLPNDIYLIIELKYCPRTKKLTRKEENILLSKEAVANLPKDLRNSCLSKAVKDKLDTDTLDELFSKLSAQPSSRAESDQILANEAKKVLNEKERIVALAQLAREKFSIDELNKILKEASARPDPTEVEIDEILSSACNDALKQIAQQNYPGVFEIQDKIIQTMGLAVYGYGTPVKAIFG